MSKVIILIPPSEGKVAGGTGSPIKKFTADVKPIGEQLVGFKGDWQKLLGVKGSALEKAIDINRSILKSPTLPAIERYSGVVYNGIDYSNLSQKAQAFFNQHVKIVSALFGLVSPQDKIPDYKLKIDKLKADRHWNAINAKELKGSFVIDLLPRAHQKAVAYDRGVFVDFVIQADGKRKPAGHFGKMIKGRFIRWLCENQVHSEVKFPQFKEEGFKWQDGVFLKKV